MKKTSEIKKKIEKQSEMHRKNLSMDELSFPRIS